MRLGAQRGYLLDLGHAGEHLPTGAESGNNNDVVTGSLKRAAAGATTDRQTAPDAAFSAELCSARRWTLCQKGDYPGDFSSLGGTGGKRLITLSPRA